MRSDDILACSVFTSLEAAREWMANQQALDRSDDRDDLPASVIDAVDCCSEYQADRAVPIGRRFRCPYFSEEVGDRLRRFDPRRFVRWPRLAGPIQADARRMILTRPLSRGEPHGRAKYPRRRHLRPLGV